MLPSMYFWSLVREGTRLRWVESGASGLSLVGVATGSSLSILLSGRGACSGFTSSSPSEHVRSIKWSPRQRLSMRWPTSFRDRENLRELLGRMLTGAGRSTESQSRCSVHLESCRESAQKVVTKRPSDVLPLVFSRTTAVCF